MEEDLCVRCYSPSHPFGPASLTSPSSYALHLQRDQGAGSRDEFQLAPDADVRDALEALRCVPICSSVVRFSGRVLNLCALLLPFCPCRDSGTTTLDACILPI